MCSLMIFLTLGKHQQWEKTMNEQEPGALVRICRTYGQAKVSIVLMDEPDYASGVICAGLLARLGVKQTCWQRIDVLLALEWLDSCQPHRESQ